MIEDDEITVAKSGVEVSKEQIHVTKGRYRNDGKKYVFRNINIARTSDGELALVSEPRTDNPGIKDFSIFIGNTKDKFTWCDGLVSQTRIFLDEQNVFSKNNQIFVGRPRNDTIIRKMPIDNKYAYFYTFNMYNDLCYFR